MRRLLDGDVRAATYRVRPVHVSTALRVWSPDRSTTAVAVLQVRHYDVISLCQLIPTFLSNFVT